MSIYIKDSETSDLLERYAATVGLNKTAALRELLRRQMDVAYRAKDADARFKSVLELIGPKLAAGPVPPISKKRFDAIYDYMDRDREQAGTRRPQPKRKTPAKGAQ